MEPKADRIFVDGERVALDGSSFTRCHFKAGSIAVYSATAPFVFDDTTTFEPGFEIEFDGYARQVAWLLHHTWNMGDFGRAEVLRILRIRPAASA